MLGRSAYLRAVWLRLVPEPRYVSIVYTFVYGIFVLTGVATLLVPPQTIAGVLGEAGMNIVGSFFLVGGLIGMITGWREWWEMERLAIAVMFTGLVFYAGIVFQLHFVSQGSRFTQLGVIGVASLVLVLRAGNIWRYPYKPRG